MEGVLVLAGLVVVALGVVALVVLRLAFAAARRRRQGTDAGEVPAPSGWEILGWVIGLVALGAVFMAVLSLLNVSVPIEAIGLGVIGFAFTALLTGGVVRAIRQRPSGK